MVSSHALTPTQPKSHQHCAEILTPRPHGRAFLGEGGGPSRRLRRTAWRRGSASCRRAWRRKSATQQPWPASNAALTARSAEAFPGDRRGGLAAALSSQQRASQLTRPTKALPQLRPAAGHMSSIATARQRRQPLDAARIGNDAEADLGRRDAARSAATTKSQASANSNPPPKARPLTRAINGLSSRNSAQAGEAARAVVGARRLPFRRGLESHAAQKQPIGPSGSRHEASDRRETSGCKVAARGRSPRRSRWPSAVERHLVECAAPDYANGRCHRGPPR